MVQDTKPLSMACLDHLGHHPTERNSEAENNFMNPLPDTDCSGDVLQKQGHSSPYALSPLKLLAFCKLKLVQREESSMEMGLEEVHLFFFLGMKIS